MAKRTEQIEELVARTLEPGEELIAIARVNYNGTVPANTFSVSSRVLTSDETVKVEIDPDSTAFFPTANQMALALTGGRLFVWGLGISGKPKQFLGLVPLNAIAEAPGRDLGAGRQALRVVMKSGALVDLEFMRGEAGAEFVEQLQALVGPPVGRATTAEIARAEVAPADEPAGDDALDLDDLVDLDEEHAAGSADRGPTDDA